MKTSFKRISSLLLSMALVVSSVSATTTVHATENQNVIISELSEELISIGTEVPANTLTLANGEVLDLADIEILDISPIDSGESVMIEDTTSVNSRTLVHSGAFILSNSTIPYFTISGRDGEVFYLESHRLTESYSDLPRSQWLTVTESQRQSFESDMSRYNGELAFWITTVNFRVTAQYPYSITYSVAGGEYQSSLISNGDYVISYYSEPDSDAYFKGYMTYNTGNLVSVAFTGGVRIL